MFFLFVLISIYVFLEQASPPLFGRKKFKLYFLKGKLPNIIGKQFSETPEQCTLVSLEVGASSPKFSRRLGPQDSS